MRNLKIEFRCNPEEARSIIHDYLDRKVDGNSRFKFKLNDEKIGPIYSFGIGNKKKFRLVLFPSFGKPYYNRFYQKKNPWGVAVNKVGNRDMCFDEIEVLSEIGYTIVDDVVTIYFKYSHKFNTKPLYRKVYNVWDLHQELFDKLNDASAKYVSDNNIVSSNLSIDDRLKNIDRYILVYYDEITNKTGIMERIG